MRNPSPAKDCVPVLAAQMPGEARHLASAELLPGARVVRAFNAIGSARLPEIAKRQSERTGMPIAGDDASAVAVASRLIRDIGLEP